MQTGYLQRLSVVLSSYPLSLTRASPCALAGQPQRSAAARSRLLGYRASHPPLLTDGRSERRQPLEERLKVCDTSVAMSLLLTPPSFYLVTDDTTLRYPSFMCCMQYACACHAQLLKVLGGADGAICLLPACCALTSLCLSDSACVTRGWLHSAAKHEAHQMHLHGEVKNSWGMSQVYTELDQDPVPHALLRNYISYARTHVHPVLSSEAKQVGPIPSAYLVQTEVHCRQSRSGRKH